MPENVSQTYWDLYHYQPTAQRYNADGEREDLAYPFTDASLDSSVFPGLVDLDLLFPGSRASIGDVSVDYEYDIDVLDFGYSYGLTSKLSIGFHIPYYWITNNVKTSLDTTNANVGLIPGSGACCAPIGAGVTPMNTDDVQNLVISEFGFSKIDSWQREGIGDTELGAKYLFFLHNSSALAMTGGLRIPTGYVDDADKLNDVAWSYGNYALLLRLHYDYLISNLWKSVPTKLHHPVPTAGDLVLNLTLRYDYMLKDKKTMRVGDDPGQILTSNRERVSREPGDLFNLEISTKYQATDALSFSAIYTYGSKTKDSIDGDLAFNYASLEANTDSSQQIFILTASYSTLAAYREKQSPAPMEFSITYRERFDGEGPSSGQVNPVLHTSWVVLGFKLLF
ncbi:MAG: transporter [Gammaproteobacteria bacterium]|nr:transporter [Gammaproteobacteria bacterium]